jgi:hypothetical protein
MSVAMLSCIHAEASNMANSAGGAERWLGQEEEMAESTYLCKRRRLHNRGWWGGRADAGESVR